MRRCVPQRVISYCKAFLVHFGLLGDQLQPLPLSGLKLNVVPSGVITLMRWALVDTGTKYSRSVPSW